MAERFEDFFGHEQESVDIAARVLFEIERDFKNGSLSKSEFEELANDVIELELVNNLSDDIDQKSVQQKVINSFKYMIEVIIL